MNPSKRPNENITSAVYFITGIAAVLMGYSVYSHLKTLQDRSNNSNSSNNSTTTKRSLSKSGNNRLEDSIPLKSLAYLTQSHNVNIQSSSTKIILERAMSVNNLSKIIAACDKDQPIEIRSKALPSLQLLTRKENNKAALLEAGALEVLVDALKCTDPEMKEVTQRFVAVAICDLIQGSDINKYCILELGVLDPIKRILTSDEIRNNELKYWTLMILYQISLSDPLPKVLIKNGFVSLLARMARMTYGNTNMPKFCMQSLVRIAANVDVSEAKKVLQELFEHNIVDLISNCLRGDDVELIYWAAGLMHEFVLKDVAADKFREIKGIHAILAGLLSAEEMYISRVILRTIKFMAYGQEKFKREMVRSGMVKKIMHCLSLDDEDVRYWAILCIHVVAGQVESHQDIISAPEFEILLELALSPKIKVATYVSDILSLICCISSNNTYMEPNLSLIVKTLNTLLMEGELDVQYNAAGAIFNVMTMNHNFATKVRDICFETLIMQSTMATHERVQLTCTKGALMVAIKNHFLLPQVNHQVTKPLMDTVNTVSQVALPVALAQALRQAAQEESESPTKTTGLSIRDVINTSLNEDEHYLIEEQDSNIPNEEGDDEQEIQVDGENEEVYPRTPEYIDVSEQGIISNASRLERVLKKNNSTISGGKRGESSSDSSSCNTIDSSSIAYLFDTSIPLAEREAMLSKFELPLSARNQLVGALTALNILLENQKIVSNVVGNEISRYPILDATADILTEIDDVDISATVGGSNSSSSKAPYRRPLPSNMCQLVQNLVYLALHPALNKWASIHHYRHPLSKLDHRDALELYQNVVEWICTCTKLPEHAVGKTLHRSSRDVSSSLHGSLHSGISDRNNNSSSDSSGSSSSDEDGFVTIRQQPRKKEYLLRSSRRHRRSRSSGGDSNSSSTDDESGQDRPVPSFYPPRKKIESAAERMGETRRKGFSNRALVLLNSLSHHDAVKNYLINEAHFISILVYLYEDCSGLTDRVMECLGGLFGSSADVEIPESVFRHFVILLWRDIRLPLHHHQKKAYLFYNRLVLSYCSRAVATTAACSSSGNVDNGDNDNDNDNNDDNTTVFVKLDLASKSKYCLVNMENRLQVRNDSWTFETIQATHCIPAIKNQIMEGESHKYAFEVLLESSGLMQVGWVTHHFESDSEGGKGVGDDAHSYGYDGNRCKKWHGRYTCMRTSYGLKWAEGDVITCALDMDEGELRYYKNGKDMGVAFYGDFASRPWYPAISLATGQQCKFQFGSMIDKLRYLPEGYISVGEYMAKYTSKHTPPINSLTDVMRHFEAIASDESDITDLAKALEKMSVHSNTNSPVSFNDANNTPDAKDAFSATTAEKIGNHAFLIEKLDAYQKPLPSLYFEVKVGFVCEDMIPRLAFGLQSLDKDSSFYFEYNGVQKLGCLVLGESCSQSFELCIQDGDTLGVIYIHDSSEIGLTLNGDVKMFVYLDEAIKTRPYLPFVTGCMRSEINYGEQPFVWKYADSSCCKLHIARYFDSLLGHTSSSSYSLC